VARAALHAAHGNAEAGSAAAGLSEQDDTNAAASGVITLTPVPGMPGADDTPQRGAGAAESGWLPQAEIAAWAMLLEEGVGVSGHSAETEPAAAPSSGTPAHGAATDGMDALLDDLDAEALAPPAAVGSTKGRGLLAFAAGLRQ